MHLEKVLKDSEIEELTEELKGRERR